MAEPDAGRKSFEEFAAGALPALLRFGHVLTGSPTEAEDLVQEALAKSLRRWRKVLSGGGDQGTHATPAAAGHASATRSAPGHPATVVMPDVTGLDLKQAG